jgi:hypothetical protein
MVQWENKLLKSHYKIKMANIFETIYVCKCGTEEVVVFMFGKIIKFLKGDMFCAS